MEKNVEIKKYIKQNYLDLEKIIDDYSGYIKKIIENMTGGNLSCEDIEEIVSDTFFILWKNNENLDINKPISSYIAGITRNLVREKTRVVNINYDISDYENSISDLKEVDMLCEERERTSIIKNSLIKMKEEDSKIFCLYYYSSRKIKEIAYILNISEFKVKSRLHRIRKKIKNDLEKGGYSYDG